MKHILKLLSCIQKVKILKTQSQKEFGLTLRVHDGKAFADEDATLASIMGKDTKGGKLCFGGLM